jgi:hypothetical protein
MERLFLLKSTEAAEDGEVGILLTKCKSSAKI